MKPRFRMCDRCEKSFSESMLVYDGGLYLCRPCKKQCDEIYPKLMAEEANEGNQK